MCIAIVTGKHPLYSTVVVSNRDEYFERPTARVAEEGGVIRPRDLAREEHGTWIGVTRGGKLAVLVNYREKGDGIGAVSRGRIPVDYLESRKGPREWVAGVGEMEGVGGFTLLFGDLGGRKAAKGSGRVLQVSGEENVGFGDNGRSGGGSLCSRAVEAVKEAKDSKWPRVGQDHDANTLPQYGNGCFRLCAKKEPATNSNEKEDKSTYKEFGSACNTEEKENRGADVSDANGANDSENLYVISNKHPGLLPFATLATRHSHTLALSNSRAIYPWPKVAVAEQMMEDLIARDVGGGFASEDDFFKAALDLMNTQDPALHAGMSLDAAFEDIPQSIFVPELEGPCGAYGTRTQTLIAKQRYSPRCVYLERDVRTGAVLRLEFDVEA